MTANIKTLVDAFVTQINNQDYNIAEDINALQEALDAIAYANIGQASFANAETLAGTKTLTDDSPALQFLNPNTADRDVSLAAVAATNHSTVIMNTNGGNYVLTVKNAGGTVIRIVPPGKAFIFVSDGTQWIVVGFDLYKTISPAQITASQNNYNPTGAYEADIMRLDSDAAWDMTGLAGGSAGRIKVIRNIGAFTLTFKNEDASSTAANRFDFGADFALETKKTMLLIYDPTSARWGMIGGGGAATPSSVGDDGWNSVSWTGLTRTGATTFTTTTDVTAIIQKGDKIKYTDTTTKYGVVYSVSVYTTICTITFIASSDYALVGTPSAMSYSKADNPQGWPGWFAFATAISNEGSTQPSQGNGTLSGRYTTTGKTLIGWVKLIWGSTTSAGTGVRLNFSLPVAASSSVLSGTLLGVASVLDSGTLVYTAMSSLQTSTTMRIMNAGPAAATALSWGTLFTPATGDEWSGAFNYEF